MGGNKSTELPEQCHFTFAGHATSTGLKNDTPLYFVGTPIFEQTGQVLLLTHDSENWIEIQRLSGEQVMNFELVFVFALYLTAILKYPKVYSSCCWDFTDWQLF